MVTFSCIYFIFLLENVEKVGYLLELSGGHDRLKLMKANLMVKGSFDQAVDGVDGVFHTASPVLVPYDNNIQANLPSISKTHVSFFSTLLHPVLI